MEIRNLKTFLKVATLKNFTSAAKELGYSQANISAQIKQLEQELDAPLFNRIGPWMTSYYRGLDAWADNWDPSPNGYVTVIYGKKGSEAERYAKENETFRGKRIIEFREI